MSYTFIKEVNYSDYKPQPILAISQEIETLKLAKTYDNFGQLVGHYNAGDYHFDNSESNAINDCNNALLEAGLINNTDEISWYYDGKAFIDDLYGENENCNKEAIENFANSWREENESLTEVEGFDYWDGNNWKTVTTSVDQYEPTHEIVGIEGLNDEVDSAWNVESKGAFHLYESENYWMVESQYTTAFEKYSIYLKSEVDRDDIF